LPPSVLGIPAKTCRAPSRLPGHRTRSAPSDRPDPLHDPADGDTVEAGLGAPDGVDTGLVAAGTTLAAGVAAGGSTGDPRQPISTPTARNQTVTTNTHRHAAGRAGPPLHVASDTSRSRRRVVNRASARTSYSL